MERLYKAMQKQMILMHQQNHLKGWLNKNPHNEMWNDIGTWGP